MQNQVNEEEAVEKTSESDASLEYSPGQLMRIAAIYEFLAKAIPTEGRDYGIRFMFPDKNNPSAISVKFEHFTDLGKLWCDYCSELLVKQMGRK